MNLRNTTLDDLAAVIGFTATLRLCAWFGDGNTMYIPVQAHEDQVIARLVGVANAARLSAEWPGEYVAVPRLRDYEDDLKKRTIAKLLEKGFSWRETAGLVRISERRVQQICRELEIAGLIRPIKPVKNGGEKAEAEMAEEKPE